MDVFTNSFSRETWYQKYKFKDDECVEDTWGRVSSCLASIEKDKKKWAQEFYDILHNFQFVPGGRITSNAGTGLKGTTFINCFVAGFEGKDRDSIEGIYRAVLRQAQILKSEGGYGFCADTMRPSGAHIGGIANQTPGAVKFLEIWDKSSEVITAGSNKKAKKNEKNFIRKGAQMVTLSCWHPDVLEFITAKKTPGRLTKFNMSVLCTDKFMEAVEKDECWFLKFPNIELYKEEYEEHWNGDIDAWEKLILDKYDPARRGDIHDLSGIKFYPGVERARDLWELIMDNTYNRNEPGVLFVDTMNRMNNLNWLEHISATNPCGEQILPPNGSCLLASINLIHFIIPETKDWDYDKLKKVIHVGIRLMDNVNDITNVPLEAQKADLLNKRRIGLGVLGYGSALLMARIKYGSKKALELTEDLMQFITNEAYIASAMLAKEKGAFPLYDEEQYLRSEFVKTLNPETFDMIAAYGIRNSHLTSIQPTGNSSCFANLVSGGLEPVFLSGYVRTSIQPVAPEKLFLPTEIDWEAKTYEIQWVTGTPEQNWQWTKEGDENLLATIFEDKTWKFDRSRGLLKEEWVEDYGVSYLKKEKKWNPDAQWASFTTDLDVDAHVNTMAIFAKWVDSAISKCVSEDTKIYTDQGLYRIKDLLNEKPNKEGFYDPKRNFTILDENGEHQKIKKVYYGGQKYTKEVTFSNGMKITCSENHKFKTNSGWLAVKDLTIGDKVQQRIGTILTPTNSLQSCDRPDWYNCIEYDFPAVMTKDLAKFIGMWLADGFTSDNSVGIVEKDDSVRLECERLFPVIFGTTAKISTDKRSGVRTHQIHSRALVKYFRQHYGKDCVSKTCPSQIFQSPREVIIEFLAGVTLDGYIQQDNLVLYEGYSEGLALDISYLLHILGYEYWLGTKYVKQGRKSKFSYCIKGYLTDKQILPIETHKQNYTTRGQRNRQTLISTPNKLPKSNHPQYYSYRNLRKAIMRDGLVKTSLLDKLNYDYDPELSLCAVTSIVDDGKHDLYDLEIENTPSYLINGIVSHNTINLPNDYPFEDFKQVYTKAWKRGIKGFTTYRAGTMASVLASQSSLDEGHKVLADIERPKKLECDVHHISVKGEKYFVLVGLYEDQPYEIFAGKNGFIGKQVKKGEIIRMGRPKGLYKAVLEDGLEISPINATCSAEEDALTRMASLSLRLSSNMQLIVQQLEKVKGDMHCLAKSMSRAIKKYIPDGVKEDGSCPECTAKDSLIRQEGCITCTQCAYSACL